MEFQINTFPRTGKNEVGKANTVKSFLYVAISLFLGSLAAPAQAEVQIYKDTSGTVYISGLQANEFVKVAYGNLLNKIQVRPSGTCNYLKLPYKASEPGFYPWNEVNLYPSGTGTAALTFTGNDLNTSDANEKALCDGAGPNMSLNWSDLGNGAYGLRNTSFTAVYIVGLPYKVYDAKDGLPSIRQQKANSCGILKLSNTSRWPASSLGTFYFYANSSSANNPSGDYELSTLPLQSPHLCQKGVLYIPAS